MASGLKEWGRVATDFLQEVTADKPAAEARILRDLQKLAAERHQLRDITKPLGSGLFELKTKEFRFLYVFYQADIVILVCFVKKGQKTPRSILDLARDRQRKILAQEVSLGDVAYH